MVIEKYLDPKNDAAFKRIFRTEKNKGILVGFLNDILELEGNARVQEVEFMNPQLAAEHYLSKPSVVDVICRDSTGRRFIVEIQIAKTDGFHQRVQLYAHKTHVEQLRVGSGYSGLEQVIFLAILDFIEFPDIEDLYYTGFAAQWNEKSL